MIDAAVNVSPPGALRRLVGLLRDFVVGALLCLTPVTSLIALGWLTRMMKVRTEQRWGMATEPVGWVLGARGSGWITRLLGGIAANIRAGVTTFVGLTLSTLPFTAIWTFAWWAGWDNSFNKGYEQAAVGPLTWLTGAAIAMTVLVHLPMALAHAAAEGRLSAFFELRKIRSLTTAASWRIPWLALLSVVASLPLLAARALPVFVEDIVPSFAQMSYQQQADVAGTVNLLTAAYAFVALWFLRTRAANHYAAALPRAATGRLAHLWVGHPQAQRAPQLRPTSRIMSGIWHALAFAIWFGLIAQIVIGQFMNYETHIWLTHPLYLLPWPG